MKKIVAMLIIMIGCMVSVSAQDHEFNKTLRKAENGDVQSMFSIGDYYANGYYGCTVNGDKALYWWVKCMKNGGYKADYSLEERVLDMWCENRKIIHDTYNAFNLIKEGAGYNKCELQFMLGDCYYEGFGVSNDYSKALKCYECGWNELNKSSYYDYYDYYAFRIGKCYCEGTPKNYKKAMNYFNKCYDKKEAKEIVFKIYDEIYSTDTSLDTDFFEFFYQVWDLKVYYDIKNREYFLSSLLECKVMYYLGYAYEMNRGIVDKNPMLSYVHSNSVSNIDHAKTCYEYVIKSVNKYNFDPQIARLARQRLDALMGNSPQPNNNLATINFQSSASSSSTSYNLQAGIKSSSRITNVSVSVNNTRGISSVANDGYDFILNKNLTLNSGNNTITVSVTNSAGTTSKSLNVYVSAQSVVNTTTGRRIALVMGIKDYQYTTPLKNPINDANALENKLRQCGFEVVKRTNLRTADEIQRAINDFGARARNGYDVALFFYAGHGINYQNESWIVPTNARINCLQDIPNQCANAGWIMDATSGVKNRIVIFDACRNLPKIDDCSHSLSRDIESHVNGISDFKKGGGAFIAYATSFGETSGDGVYNGVYTGELLKVLDNRGWDIIKVFQETAKRVHQITNGTQNPWNTSAFYDDFIFNR